MKEGQLKAFAWGSSAVASLLAVVVWGQGISWQFSVLSNYTLFPLFGLLAFSLMWSHYITSALRQYSKIEKGVLKDYFEATSAVVLGAILLHPGLLAYQLWRDGLGLPPGSELNYLPSSKDFYILIAMFSLFVFLSYELRRLYEKRSWWKYVQYASDVAIILIYLHAFNVGSQLQQGWFRAVWYFYGLTLAAALVYINMMKYQKYKSAKTT